MLLQQLLTLMQAVMWRRPHLRVSRERHRRINGSLWPWSELEFKQRRCSVSGYPELGNMLKEGAPITSTFDPIPGEARGTHERNKRVSCKGGP